MPGSDFCPALCLPTPRTCGKKQQTPPVHQAQPACANLAENRLVPLTPCCTAASVQRFGPRAVRVLAKGFRRANVAPWLGRPDELERQNEKAQIRLPRDPYRDATLATPGSVDC